MSDSRAYGDVMFTIAGVAVAASALTIAEKPKDNQPQAIGVDPRWADISVSTEFYLPEYNNRHSRRAAAAKNRRRRR